MAEAAPVRWGIMGTGKIASDFVKCLRVLEGAEVVGVGSRSAASAEVFASEHGLSCAQAFGSYEALASSEAVEVVYIATPIDRHVEDSLLCLRADKAVLCEKSMARDAGEAATVVQVARERGLFFMHGVWTACFPAVREARRLVAQGEAGPLGTVRQCLVDYNQNDDRSADTLGGAEVAEGRLVGEPLLLNRKRAVPLPPRLQVPRPGAVLRRPATHRGRVLPLLAGAKCSPGTLLPVPTFLGRAMASPSAPN